MCRPVPHGSAPSRLGHRIVTGIGKTALMAFGQSAGPPATHKQMDELLALVMEAGFQDFREARYQMDFTQRQAGGKFSRDEADEYIAMLQERSEIEGESIAPVQAAPKLSANERAIRKFSDAELAAELQRRGWIVAEP